MNGGGVRLPLTHRHPRKTLSGRGGRDSEVAQAAGGTDARFGDGEGSSGFDGMETQIRERGGRLWGDEKSLAGLKAARERGFLARRSIRGAKPALSQTPFGMTEIT